ncbi:MAG: hypothetical protein CMM71_01170 [Rhodospirillaceae bacterium]|nr:hypothetical protein [Rhodospirillaceae bacterium]
MNRVLVFWVLCAAAFAAAFVSGAQAQFTVGGVTGGAPTAGVNCFGDADGRILAYSSGWTAADCGLYSQVCNANQFTCPPASTLCTNGEFCGTGPYVTITTPTAAQSAWEVATNVAPVLNTPNCPSAIVDQDYSCILSAIDANNNPVTFALANKAGWMQFNVATGAITGRPPAVINAENLTATATDSYNAASTPATFSILVINNAPTIGAFTCPDGVPNTPYACTIGGYDQDGHTLVYTATNLPGWASFDISSGTISGTPTAVATHAGIAVTVSDSYGGTATTPAFQLEVVAGASETAAAQIIQAISQGSLSAADITTLMTAQSLTVDADLDLAGNPVHLAWVQQCIGSKTVPAEIAACAAVVDGTVLSQYEVAEVLSGAQSGSVNAELLVKAGISGEVSGIAAGNSCGPDQDQSCLTAVLGPSISSLGDVTQANFENTLANYFEAAISQVSTSVAQHSVKACPGGPTVFTVPNPPPLCSSFAHWNCTSNTNGISVLWTDNGKGNVQATTGFAGGQYTLTASMNIGSVTRTRQLTGTFNINAVSTAHAAGYRTGSQPGYWGNPFNPLAGAASSCSSQGGTLGTHSDIREANTAHGTIIPNGTRVIFRAANGDADAYTGSSSSTTKPQCSNDFHQTAANNIKGFQYRNNNQARCDNRSRSENFTYLCKNVPTSCQ